MSSRVRAASDQEDEVVVGADAHREPRLRHLRRQRPLVLRGVVPEKRANKWCSTGHRYSLLSFGWQEISLFEPKLPSFHLG